MTELNDDFTLPCGQHINNRIAKAAMTEGLTVDGNPNDKLNCLYRRWAEGGAALIISGNVMINRNYLERPGNVVLDKHANLDAFQAWAKAGQQNDTKFWLQISHPGRQCTKWVNKEPVAPSSVELDLLSMFQKPRALTHDEILGAIDDYATSALLAQQSGFNGVQIHAAHGYLISQFLSPVTNQRDDEWGGDLEGRSRFLLEVIKAVKAKVSAPFAVGIKLNSSDFQKGGWSIEDCLKLVEKLNEFNLDLIELSGGTYEQPQLFGHHGDKSQATQPTKRKSTVLREAYFVEYAAQVRQVATSPLMVTGGFSTKAALTAALEHVDIIGVARPFCVAPNWPSQLFHEGLEELPRFENKITGTGKWGPASPYKMIQVTNIQGEVAWFYYQILRLSEDKMPNFKKKIVPAILYHFGREQWLAHKRRKLMRSYN